MPGNNSSPEASIRRPEPSGFISYTEASSGTAVTSAGLIGTIIAPISSILSLLEQPAVQLMGLLQAYSDKDKAEGGAEAA